MSLTHYEPGPIVITAADDPWKLDPGIARHIRCTAASMVGKAGLTQQDREDLEQELTAHLLSRISQFNPGRSGLNTFVTRLLDNAAASYIVARKREKRDWRREGRSLDEEVKNDEGELKPLLELLELEQGLRGESLAHEVQREREALRIDLERAIATLPVREQRVCRLLMRHDARRAAALAGMSRSTLYQLLIKLRAAFESAGLKVYL